MINYEFKNFKINELIENINSKNFILPRFQRKVTWNFERQKKLIETLRNGDPIGMLLFSKEGDRYQIIDGQQRLTTLRLYHESPMEFIDETYIDSNLIEQLINEEKQKNTDFSIVNYNTAKIRKENYIDCVVSVFRELYEENKEKPNTLDKVQRIFLKNVENALKDKVLHYDESILNDILDKIIENIKLPEIEIPVTVYKGSNENLADLFYNVNTGSVKLSKYETFAAKWYSTKIENVPEEMFENAVKKYDVSDKSEQFEFVDDSGDDGSINLFEYCLSISEMLCSNSKGIYVKAKSVDTSEIAFELLSILFTGFPNKTDSILTIFGAKEGVSRNELFFKKLYTVLQDVNNHIARNLSWLYSHKNCNVIKSSYLLHQVFVSCFYEMYEIEHSYLNSFNQRKKDMFIDPTTSMLNDVESTIKKTGNKVNFRYVPINILNLEITRYWSKNRQITDVHEHITNEETRKSLFNKISERSFNENVLEWINEQSILPKYKKATIAPENKTIAFIIHNMMCKYNSKYYNIFENKNSLEIDHIVAKSALPSEVARSSAPNLIVIDGKSNNKKKDKNLYLFSQESFYHKEDDYVFKMLNITKEEFKGFVGYNDYKKDDKIKIFNEWYGNRKNSFESMIMKIYNDSCV